MPASLIVTLLLVNHTGVHSFSSNMQAFVFCVSQEYEERERVCVSPFCWCVYRQTYVLKYEREARAVS